LSRRCNDCSCAGASESYFTAPPIGALAGAPIGGALASSAPANAVKVGLGLQLIWSASNNAAERALRGVAIGRKAWLFAGSDRDGERTATMYSLITTAKLNDVDPQAWLAVSRLDELLPWNWCLATTQAAA
jgi:hypothetical protein